MASGGNPRPDDNYSSDGGGDTTDAESADESPRPPRKGLRANPILTRLSVSRNPSPLSAATAAPGVCLLRFAWESAAGSLVGAVVGYGTHTPRPSTLHLLAPVGRYAR
jgi:import inner membrane translocase subunit TIM22